MNKPLVSVIIPTFRRPELVGRAIKSVLAQTMQGFEIIVVDDYPADIGGDGKTKEVVLKFDDRRIRYVAHEKNKGCSGAKNTGVQKSGGQYIAFLDDDDEWLPEKLAVQLTALKGTPDDVGFSFHGAVEIFDDREAVTNVPDGTADYFDFALRTFSEMIASSMMYKRGVFDVVGGLDETFPTHTGAEFIIRVAKKYKGIGINQPLVRREIRGSHVQMGSNIGNRIRGREMLLARYEEDFKKRPAYLAKHLEQLGRFHRDIGSYKQARVVFWRAFMLQPRMDRFAHAVSMVGDGFLYKLFRPS